MSAYSDKLKDPRWQKKRLEILERDKWACQICGDTESPLNVHHKDYFPNKEIWEYPDKILVTLCDYCHEGESQNIREKLETELLHILRINFSTIDLYNLNHALKNLEFQPDDVLLLYETPQLLERVRNA